MANDKSPAFQWYPKDIFTSVRVAMMTLEEEGAYRRAIDLCWLNGSLPNDPEKLAKVIGKNCSIEVANTVQQMFIVDKKNPEKIFHERLEVERKKQRDNRLKKSKAGIRSGASRRNKNKLGAEQVLDFCSDSVRTKDEQKRTLHLQSSSSSSSPENSSSNARAREDSQPNPPPMLNGSSGALSGFTEEACREYVDALIAAGRDDIKNPGGLAHSIFISGKSDRDIRTWLDAGKSFGAKKRKAVIPG